MNTPSLIAMSGLKDAELSRICGVHRATVGRWRNGECQPDTAETISALSKALGVAPRMVRPDLARVFER